MKEFLIKYKFGILLTLFLLTIGIFVAVNIQSCKNKVKTILTVPGYDSAFHKFADSLNTAILRHNDSVDNAYAKKFELYDSTVMNSDIRMEVRRQVYNELKKFRKQQSGQELDDELRRRISK